MLNTVQFTEPILCHYNHDITKSWFVYFDAIHPQTNQKKRIQFRGSINRIPKKEQRLKAGNALVKFWKARIEEGWSPFEQLNAQLIYPSTPFIIALDFALSKCNNAKDTIKGYRGTVKFVKEAATQLGIHNIPIFDIDKPHIKMIMDKIKADRGWSNHSYNKNLGYLGAVLSNLKDWKVNKFNPAHEIELLPEAETEKYIPLTPKEKKELQEHLFIHHYRYFIYLLVLYHTGIRPKEVLALQIKDIDLDLRIITIRPDLERENSKVKTIRIVPIVEQLYLFFYELQLRNYPSNYFLFGSPFEKGKGNRGSTKEGRGATHPDYFKPSTTQIKRDTVTRLWKKIVVEKLGIEKHQYAMKHTGANDKIMAGIDIKALSDMYGHSSIYMTEKYIRKVKNYYRQQIIDKAPDFSAT